MDALNELWTGIWVVAVKVGVCAAVNGLLSVNDFAEIRAELLICCISRGPKSVTTDAWDSVVVKMSDACWVKLMNKIAVPSGSSSWLSE